MDFKESTIKTYSGLSSETKPTIAGGADVPNGSRWREVDTGKEYHFNLADDTWYLLSTEIKPIAGASPTTDLRVLAVLESCELLLKKIEYHLMLATDADLTNQEV